jgi:oligopeptide/dipeptide ABC transporter ATP-binding protein
LKTLIEVKGLTKHFLPSRLWMLAGAKVTKAVDDVSFTIDEGTVLGLVGESGCGKTTTGRLILRLIEPTGGEVYFNGVEVTKFNSQDLFGYRRQAQIIFQNPFSAFNPRRTVESSLSVGLEAYKLARGREKREQLEALLQRVGLSPDMLDRYPHEFSGGQRQRLGIARALSVEPKFIVADEPVSALDVSIQAQVLNLLRELQEELRFTMLFISHDLRTIYHMSDRIAVMYLGRLVEIATKQSLYGNPLHPYTRALIAAAPSLEPGQTLNNQIMKGEVWDKPPPPDGCVFYHRCPLAVPDCEHIVPELDEKETGHRAACWRV